MAEGIHGPDRLTLAAFTAAALIGGVNFVAVRVSNRELAPVFGAGARFGVAAILLLVFVVVRRVPWPRGSALGATVAYGVLAFTATYALAYWALQELSAGVGATVFGATPLITILLASAHGLEKITTRGIIGAVLAVAGIAILANPLSNDRLPLLPLLAILGAGIAAAESAVILKLVPPRYPVATNAVAMTIGAGLLLAISAVSGESWSTPSELETWLALGYLVVLGSVGLFGLILFTLSRWIVSAVAYITALFPLVAVLAGFVIAGEEITASVVVGGVVVITGLYVGALRRSARPGPVLTRPAMGRTGAAD